MNDKELRRMITCPISSMIMRHPVTLDGGSGHVFERETVETYLNGLRHRYQPLICPISRQPINGRLTASITTNDLIDMFFSMHPEERENQYPPYVKAVAAPVQQAIARPVAAPQPHFFQPAHEGYYLPACVAIKKNMTSLTAIQKVVLLGSVELSNQSHEFISALLQRNAQYIGMDYSIINSAEGRFQIFNAASQPCFTDLRRLLVKRSDMLFFFSNNWDGLQQQIAELNSGDTYQFLSIRRNEGEHNTITFQDPFVMIHPQQPIQQRSIYQNLAITLLDTCKSFQTQYLPQNNAVEAEETANHTCVMS